MYFFVDFKRNRVKIKLDENYLYGRKKIIQSFGNFVL